ncbi:hypothetical protein B0H13DRAFT_1857403 [Mycena leptocephala]|nr:hypothetical protein B0H13DRAFT_1857403 [Mycena leptocephala]
MVDTWKATKAARFAKVVAAVVPHAASAAPIAPPAAPVNPTAAYTSPMAIYALSTLISDENADDADVVVPPSIYAANSTSVPTGAPTFLDTGASDHCVVNRARFVTYEEIDVEGSTALKSGGEFKVAGKGLAAFEDLR